VAERRQSTTFALSAVTFAVALMLASGAKAEELVKYEILGGTSIPKSLTGVPGDAKNGRKVAINRKQGNCLGCHKMPVPEQPFHGDVGPDLNDVAKNLSEGEIRLRIVNAKVINPGTIMPAFYRNDGFVRVMKKFKGKAMLSAQQVEDLVAYLLTLKGDS
jgi:sulfur-oxidizing protein SoxX